MPDQERVLLTGATGFVGRYLWPELIRAGYHATCLSRDVERARRRLPNREWVQGDAASTDDVRRALAGCTLAYYLVHGMAEGGPGFRRREVEGAQRFADAARDAGVRRIIYLGGMEPQGPPSEHLASRLEVGRTLRESGVPTVELRASMIVGHGSLSWLMVRDLAARLPAMVLPRWLKSRTEPVAVADVISALVRASSLPLEGSAWYDLPGPEALSGREILMRTAAAMGLREPLVIEVPVLSPWLSSHWVHFVTRAEWAVAREVVVGLNRDLLARDGHFWEESGHTRLVRFDDAARQALAAEREAGPVEGFWSAVERWMTRRWSARRPA